MTERTKRRNQRSNDSNLNILALVLSLVSIVLVVFAFFKIEEISNFFRMQFCISENVNNGYILLCLLLAILLLAFFLYLIIKHNNYRNKFSPSINEYEILTKNKIANKLESKSNNIVKADEFEKCIKRLQKDNFLHIYGGSGNGKTILAYQLLENFAKNGKKVIEIKKTVKNLKEFWVIVDFFPKNKIVLFDDAHLYNFSGELLSKLPNEEENGKFIIVTTDYLSKGTSATDNDEISINQNELIKKIDEKTNNYNKKEELNKLINNNKVKTIWQYDFILNGKEEKIENVLKNIDITDNQKFNYHLVLYIFCVRYIVKGEKEIFSLDFDNLIKNINDISDRDLIINNLINEKLIISNRDTNKNTILQCIDFNTAKEIVKIIQNIYRTSDETSKKLVKTTSEILISSETTHIDNKYIGVYFSILNSTLKEYFITQNKDWILALYENFSPENILAYSIFGKLLKATDASLAKEIGEKIPVEKLNLIEMDKFTPLRELVAATETVDKINIETIIKKINAINNVERISQIASMLSYLIDKSKTKINKINVENIAKLCNKAKSSELGQIAEFIKLIDKDKNATEIFFNHFSLKNLAEKINNREDEYKFSNLCHILNTATEKNDFFNTCKIVVLAEKANKLPIENCDEISHLLNSLKKYHNTNIFLEEFNFKNFAKRINNSSIKNFTKIHQCIKSFNDNKAITILENIEYQEIAKTFSTATLKQLGMISDFINNFQHNKQEIINNLDDLYFNDLLNKDEKEIAENIEGISKFLNTIKNHTSKIQFCKDVKFYTGIEKDIISKQTTIRGFIALLEYQNASSCSEKIKNYDFKTILDNFKITYHTDLVVLARINALCDTNGKIFVKNFITSNQDEIEKKLKRFDSEEETQLNLVKNFLNTICSS